MRRLLSPGRRREEDAGEDQRHTVGLLAAAEEADSFRKGFVTACPSAWRRAGAGKETRCSSEVEGVSVVMFDLLTWRVMVTCCSLVILYESFYL